MIRAFLAVELLPGLRAELAALQQGLKQSIEPEMKRDMRISWVQSAKMHLTIKFLGDMDEQVIDPLRGEVEQAIESQPSVYMPIERLGAFPVRRVHACCGLGRRRIGSKEWKGSALLRSIARSNRLVKTWAFFMRQNRSVHI